MSGAGFGAGSSTTGGGGGGGGVRTGSGVGSGAGSGSGVGSGSGAGSGGSSGAAAVCTDMSHTSASTVIGVLAVQLTPIHRNASNAACTATASRNDGRRLGSGGTWYGTPALSGFISGIF